MVFEEIEENADKNQELGKKRVVIYARVSKKEQKKKKTVDTQVDLLTPIIRTEGYEHVDTIKDEDVSGDSDPEKRPGFSRIIEMADRREIDEVWVSTRDRIARNVDLMGYIRTILDRKSVAVMALDDSKEKYLDKFKDVLSEMELDKYRQKRLEGIERAQREKRTLQRPPFGYISVDRKLVIDETKRGIIKALFRDFDIPLMSLKKLADKYDMSRSMIQRIRSNPIYTTGEVRWQGKVVYKIEPIISEGTEEGEETEILEKGTQVTLF